MAGGARRRGGRTSQHQELQMQPTGSRPVGTMGKSKQLETFRDLTRFSSQSRPRAANRAGQSYAAGPDGPGPWTRKAKRPANSSPLRERTKLRAARTAGGHHGPPCIADDDCGLRTSTSVDRSRLGNEQVPMLTRQRRGRKRVRLRASSRSSSPPAGMRVPRRRARARQLRARGARQRRADAGRAGVQSVPVRLRRRDRLPFRHLGRPCRSVRTRPRSGTCRTTETSA